MVASLGIFRKLANQVFKNIAHLYIVDGTGVQVQFGECLDHREQTVILVHLVNLLVKIQAADDVLDIGRETLDIGLKVCRQMVGVIDQLRQIEFAGVVELEARQAVHGLSRITGVGLIRFHDLGLGGSQGTLKAADDDHRDDDILVFVTLVCTAQFVCNRPDEVYLCGYIDGGIVPHRVNYLFISHADYLTFHLAKFCCPYYTYSSVR